MPLWRSPSSTTGGGHRQPVAGQGGQARARAGSGCGWAPSSATAAAAQILAVKAFEASKALEQGANQIDCVLNAGAMLSGDDEIVYNDMLAVVDMAHSALAAGRRDRRGRADER